MEGSKYRKHKDESLYETETLYEIAYKAGVEDAWDWFSSLINYSKSPEVMDQIFGDGEWSSENLCNFKGNNVIGLIKHYEESLIHSKTFVGGNVPELVQDVYDFIMGRDIDVLEFDFNKNIPSIKITYRNVTTKEE